MRENYRFAKEFTYKGINAFIINNSMGHRCGYIEVPRDSKFFGKRYDDIDIDIHGGFTYSEPYLLDRIDSWFIGFDCAHLYDLKDESIMGKKEKEFFEDREVFFQHGYGVLWTEEMVVNELMRAIDDLLKYVG